MTQVKSRYDRDIIVQSEEQWGGKKKIDKKTVVDLLMSNELFLISLPPLSHFLLHLHFIFIMHNLIVTRWIHDSIESPFLLLFVWLFE